MLRIYVAPSGLLYQYEEGTQPEGYVLYDAKPKAKPTPTKARAAANKARKVANK